MTKAVEAMAMEAAMAATPGVVAVTKVVVGRTVVGRAVDWRVAATRAAVKRAVAAQAAVGGEEAEPEASEEGAISVVASVEVGLLVAARREEEVMEGGELEAARWVAERLVVEVLAAA